MVWWIVLAGFVWAFFMRGYLKRRAGRLNSTISAGATRDLGGRGGF